MRVFTPAGGIRAGISMMGLCLLSSLGPAPRVQAAEGENGTLEKLIVASGRVALDVDLQQVREASAAAGKRTSSRLSFDAEKDAFMTYLVFNGELRGPLPGALRLLPRAGQALPAGLEASRDHLVVE